MWHAPRYLAERAGYTGPIGFYTLPAGTRVRIAQQTAEVRGRLAAAIKRDARNRDVVPIELHGYIAYVHADLLMSEAAYEAALARERGGRGGAERVLGAQPGGDVGAGNAGGDVPRAGGAAADRVGGVDVDPDGH
jgi:hypothetical protein